MELNKFLLKFSFSSLIYDYSLFTLKQGSSFTIVVEYVDDLLVAGTHLHDIQPLKSQLLSEFTIKDLGPLTYFLGIEVTRNKDSILLNK